VQICSLNDEREGLPPKEYLPILNGVEMSEHSGEQSITAEDFENVAHQTRRLMKHFNNRLTLDNLRLPERYLNGEVHLFMHLRHGENVEYVASFQREMPDARLQEHPRVLGFGNVFQNSEELISDFSNFGGRHTMVPILRSNSEQQTVLVNVVELMELPEKFAGPSRICLDLGEGFYGVRRKQLFYSLNSGFEFLGRISHREIDMVERSGRFGSDANQTVGQMVERAPQVLDGVASDERHIGGNGCDTSEVIKAIASIGCVLGLNWIRTTLNVVTPKILKVEDVFFGPF
jgi:hypothetical protein